MGETSPTQEIRVLRDFVTGDTPWEDLTQFGVRITFEPHGVRMEEPADTPVYEPSAMEVATGLVSHWAVGTTLQDWASVLLATGMIDLSCLEDHPDGEALLGAVWDAAAPGSEIDAQRLDVARRLAESG